ncbi:MAG TPA: SWIM zinc finger family protein [Longimicrobium sp.]
MSDWWHDAGPRRPAKNGIAARSERGEIGESWWSRRFIAALHAVADTSRLSRGRSYARSGQVMDLRVEPGSVTARVQGSAATPYRVRIRLVPFSDAEWERAEEALAAQALFLAALLAGEMPRDVEEAFTAAGLSLFPRTPRELQTECSCPDAANPCKHTAAVFYILAEAFDTDPFLVLAWRGRPRERLLEHLRALRSAAVPAAPSPAPEPAAPPPAPPPDFWRAGPELSKLRFAPRAPEIPDTVLRELGPLPDAAGGARIRQALSRAYAIFTTAAAQRALGEDDGGSN